ncbi:MAG: Gfo/Idh/MocA family protein [Phycisphaerales bacterium JB063]
MSRVALWVIGAGERGRQYTRYAAQWPERVQVVGVAEPRQAFRDGFAADFGLDSGRCHDDWRAVLPLAQPGDAVIIATQDTQHTEPAIAFLERGCHVLLEKPMAPTESECVQIARAARAGRGLFAVCHVLRYTDFSRTLKRLLDEGAIGEVVSLQRLEPVGYAHQAHSFVRGNWRNTAMSSCMLLAKACHDIDWIRYIMDARCTRVQSFGNLYHFKRSQKPHDAGDATRCVDCGYEPQCVYSAKRIYLTPTINGDTRWPVSVITSDLTVEGVQAAIEHGPYGRCVYECDNDVVDHQVVNMEFENGKTAGLTMTAFTRGRERETRLFGTLGEIYGNDDYIEVYRFETGETRRIETRGNDMQADDQHGGGDRRLMEAFLNAASTHTPDTILSGSEETLESHLMVFAAERSRLTGQVVTLPTNPPSQNDDRPAPTPPLANPTA